MKRIGTVFALGLALLACGKGGAPSTNVPVTRFSDNGVAAQDKLSRYFQQAVVTSKLRDCWSRLQGEGAIAMDFTYAKSGDSWAFDKLRATKSTLPEEQAGAALACMQDSVRATSFPLERGESLEVSAKEFVVRLSWSIPLPAEDSPLSSSQMERIKGSGGLGDVAGCSECVERTEYPYGLKCESRMSGGHLDCRENSTNVCSTAPTACLKGLFAGTGVVMY